MTEDHDVAMEDQNSDRADESSPSIIPAREGAHASQASEEDQSTPWRDIELRAFSSRGHDSAALAKQLRTLQEHVGFKTARRMVNRQVYRRISRFMGFEKPLPEDFIIHTGDVQNAVYEALAHKLGDRETLDDAGLTETELKEVGGEIDSYGFLVKDSNTTTVAAPTVPSSDPAVARDTITVEGDNDLTRRPTSNGSNGTESGIQVKGENDDYDEADEYDDSEVVSDLQQLEQAGQPREQENVQRSELRCLPCRYRHNKCDRRLPVCSSCIKSYGPDNRTHLCVYTSAKIVGPVLVPEIYKIGDKIERGRPKKRGPFDSPPRPSQSGATPVVPSSTPGITIIPLKDGQLPPHHGKGHWKKLRRLEIDRLRNILLHCLQRDLGFKPPAIHRMQYDFFLPEFATSNGYEIIAPDEFLELFKTRDPWRWPLSLWSMIPHMIKDGIISFVRPGVKKDIPFYIRDYYVREAKKEKDGWEDVLGERPSMDDVPEDQLNMPARDNRQFTRKRQKKKRMSYHGPVIGADGIVTANKRQRTAGDHSSSGSDSDSDVGNLSSFVSPQTPNTSFVAASASSANANRVRPTAFSTSFRPNQPAPSTTPSEPPKEVTPGRIRDLVQSLNGEIADLRKLAASSNNALVRMTAQEECERLKSRFDELKELESAERELESIPGLNAAVRKRMADALLRKAMEKKES